MAEHPVPEGLSERSSELWRAIVPERAESAGRRAMVEEALHSLDRADEARAAVQAEGMCFTTETTRAVHVHPAVRVERESRQLFAKLWQTLALEWSQAEDGGTDL